MASRGKNEGVRVLEDFVCEAIHDSEVRGADEKRQERNEGMRMVDHLAFEPSAEKSKHEETENSQGASPAPL
jgi:hypothetical protein